MSWIDDNVNQIVCGDSFEIIKQIPDGVVDLVLTDPPYGIGESAKKNLTRGNGLAPPTDYGDSDWDRQPVSPEHIAEIRRVSQHQIIFGGNFYDLPPSSCWLIWDKDNQGTDFADCEMAWTNFPRAVRIIKWRWSGMLQERMGSKKEKRVHLTQKPLPVMKWAITKAPHDCRLVLDPFCGSGTTCVAAKELGLAYIGIDINERYCGMARERLKQTELFPTGTGRR
jgi:DNA modification methylase